MKNWKLLLIAGLISSALVACNSQEDVGKEVDPPAESQTTGESQGNVASEDANSSEEKAQVDQGNGQSNEQQQNDGATQNIRTYVNQTDAWMVELPATWKDVGIHEEGRRTEFIFPSANQALKQSLFWITATSEQEWEKAKKEGPVGSAKEITTKNGDVYLYTTPLDMVLEGEELKRYEEMFAEIPAIIESFKFE